MAFMVNLIMAGRMPGLSEIFKYFKADELMEGTG